jgi:RNA polymerase sigma-70 factor (ECF subfamily)
LVAESAKVESGGTPRDDGRDDRRASEELRQLMIQYQAGEMTGFETLYQRLAPRLRGWFRTQRLEFGADADDLVQELFLQMHRSRHTYSPAKAVEPWVFAIARHVYLMDRRRRMRKHSRESHEVPEARIAPQPSAEQGTLERDRLDRALAHTTGRRRLSVMLHHLWGYSYREVGRLLGVRPEAAKRSGSRGVADLRKQLESEEEER